MQRLNFPLQEADRCVQCGICSRVCPTYGLERSEQASPRGRIALMQGLARGALPPSPPLLEALDRCLGCLACEAACPAGVPYGMLLDAFREGFPRRSPLLPLLTRPWAAKMAARILRLYPPTRKRLSAKRIQGRSPPAPRGQVALFRGCLGEAMDGDTLEAAVTLLNAIGYRVIVPQGQVCCGGLHLHSGRKKAYARLRAQNLQAFDLPVEAVVGTSSGCNAVLSSYPRIPFIDIHRFLLERWPRDMRLKPLKKRVVVHIPCTLRHPLKGEGDLLRLLRLIPDITLRTLPATCCGAAGDYMFRHPEMARALRDRLLEGAEGEVWVSPNLGCAFHLRERKPFLSPLSLLAGQLP